MDGAFGYHRSDAPLQPSQGGVAGLVKTAAREWPEVVCCVVELDPAITNVAELLAAELESGGEQVEVGWSPGRRITVGLTPG